MPGKTLEDLRQNPREVTAEDLRRVLLAHGWAVRGGTRHGFIAQHGGTGRTFPFPRPHGKNLLPAYVRQAVKVIAEEDAK